MKKAEPEQKSLELPWLRLKLEKIGVRNALVGIRHEDVGLKPFGGLVCQLYSVLEDCEREERRCVGRKE